MRRIVCLVVASGCAPQPVVEPASAPSGPRRAITAEGEVTWTVAYDARAREAGFEDCSYTRRYTAVEDRSTPWLCPECDVVLLADVEMGEDDLACYRSISGTEPPSQERIGWSADRFWRTPWPFGPLRPAGSLDLGGDAHERVSFVEDAEPIELPAGSIALGSAGDLSVGQAVADPWHGMLPPAGSTCGWPRAGLAPWDGPWAIEVGRLLPDGWFDDACGEPARLHDFYGDYVVVVVSAMDCGPCQGMAVEERAFVDRVRRLGVEIAAITLLAPSLDAPLDPIPTEDLALWAASFDLDTPVLGDRGWGFALSQTVWPGTMSYPSWFVATPGLEVLAVGQGYDGWEGAYEAIARHRFGY